MKRECSFDLKVLIWPWLLMCLSRKSEPCTIAVLHALETGK